MHPFFFFNWFCAGSDKNLLCLDINSSDLKLAAGTEASDTNEVDLFIW